MEIRNKYVPDIYLNLSHFIDHFIMLIFAKAAYDAGLEFGLGYEGIIIFGLLFIQTEGKKNKIKV